MCKVDIFYIKLISWGRSLQIRYVLYVRVYCVTVSSCRCICEFYYIIFNY